MRKNMLGCLQSVVCFPALVGGVGSNKKNSPTGGAAGWWGLD